jgi:osmotically inducible lipoprotein OsmB
MRMRLGVMAVIGAAAMLAGCGHNMEQRAATGAIAGAVVGGPVGAAVGATAGAATSKAADDPK